MANKFELTNLVAEQMAPELHAKSQFIGTLPKTYVKDFNTAGIQPGDTVRIALPSQFTAEMGTVANPQDTVENSVYLKVYPFVASAYVTSLQQTLDLDGEEGVRKHITSKMVLPLLRKAETFALQQATNKVWGFSGSPGTDPSTFLQYGDATSRMTEMLIPDKANILGQIYPNSYTRTMDNVKGIPNGSTSTIDNIFTKKQMKYIAGVNMMESVSLPNYIAPALNSASPQVVNSGQTGSTLNIDGMPTNYTVREGTRFTVGVFAVDPESKKVLSSLQYFVVTSDTDTSGGGTISLPIDPPIVTSGAQQTVSGSPLNNAAVVFTGAAATGTTEPEYAQNLIYAPEAFPFVSLPVAPFMTKGFSTMSEYEGLAVRISMGPDVRNNEEIIRADILVGVACTRPGWARVMIGGNVT